MSVCLPAWTGQRKNVLLQSTWSRCHRQLWAGWSGCREPNPVLCKSSSPRTDCFLNGLCLKILCILGSVQCSCCPPWRAEQLAWVLFLVVLRRVSVLLLCGIVMSSCFSVSFMLLRAACSAAWESLWKCLSNDFFILMLVTAWLTRFR